LALAALLLTAAGVQAQTVFPPQNVGTESLWQTVTVTAQTAGQISKVEVLTLGVSGLDFTPSGGVSTCPSAFLSAGATCTQSVVFTPTAPGTRVGAVVLLNSSSEVLGTAYLSGTGTGGLGVFVPANMITVAGEYRTWTSTQDGIPAVQANLDQPSSVALDGAGNMYIADSAHNRIRKVTAATGLISTIAGNGMGAYTGDGGSATKATLNTPSGVALDGAGNIYIADTANNVIRMIAASTGIITTVAGTGTAGDQGDKGQAASANLNSPLGVTVDIAGNLYIADTANQKIRKVDMSTGVITTVAGDGFTSSGGFGGYSGDNGPATAAELNLPYAVAFDAAGNMYIPDSANNRVREVDTTGKITTYAGTGQAGDTGDQGPAIDAELHLPSGVAVDPAGNLYIADTQNSAIRKVSSQSPNNIVTVAQNSTGVTLPTGATGPSSVSLYAPTGMTLDGHGDLFIADYYYMLIKKIQSNLAVLDFIPTPIRQDQVSAPQNQTLENDGNGPLDLTAITPDKNAAVDAADTTCNLGTPYLTPNEDCVIAAEFAPTVAANPLVANVDILGDTVNSPLDIELVGDTTAINSTSVSLVSSHNPSSYSQNVVFTATVTTGTGTLTGSVRFLDGNKLLTVIDLNTAGVAAFPTSLLTVGSHSITAAYSGDASHHPSTSAPLIQVVDEATATRLTAAPSPSEIGQSVTFTALVTAPDGGGVAPDGAVTFSDGATILGTTPLNAAGVATYSTAALSNGLHAITATYSGDLTNYILSSTSAVLDQEVQAGTTTVVTSKPNPSVHGAPVTFTATVTPSGSVAPTGGVSFLDGGKLIGSGTLVNGVTAITTSALAAGSHIVTAAYAGNADDGASVSAPITQVVTLAQTATTVAAIPNPGTAGKPVTITATVKLVAGVATPTGSVGFSDGKVTIGTAPLNAGDTAAITVTLAPGDHSIVANYMGDANDDGSASAPLSLVIQLATTSVALTVTPNPSIIDSPIVIAATVTGNGGTPTGNVTFLADGTPIGMGKLDAAGSATLTYSSLNVGSHSITVNYAGDADDSASSSGSVDEVVQAIPTVTDLGTSSASGAQVTLVASVFGSVGPTPTGTVSFDNGKTVIGTATLNSSGVATLSPQLNTGNYSIVAVYSGDPIHSPSSSQPVSVSGMASGFDLSVDPSSVTVATRQNATVNVTLKSSSGFSDTIGLGCASVPAAVTCHFSSIDVGLAANGTQKVQLTIDTNYPLSGGTSASNKSPNGIRGVALAGIFLPFSAFFGFVFWRLRKRSPAILTAVLVLSLSGAALLVTGCGGFTQISATPGTYVIQVTAVGANSNITHYQNVTLDVTQ
jgi:sugar lactone lactonase YvrE